MNEESNNNMPELAAPEQLAEEERQQRYAELDAYWLDPAKEYPEPHYLYEFNGVGFSPLGGIQAISGQKKNGKTFVLAQLMAVALGTGLSRVEQYLPGLRTRQDTINFLGQYT